MEAEENKHLSYSKFKECVCKDLKRYFSDTELRKKNYEVALREDRDAYDEVEELVYLLDLKNPEKNVPSYSLPVAYETYCRSGDINKVLAALATTLEKQYPQEQTPQIMQEKISMIIIQEVPGYLEEDIDIRTVYVITDQEGERTAVELLKEDETLAAIADKEGSHLQVIIADEKTIWATSAVSETEIEENLAIIEELQNIQLQNSSREYWIYDKDKNLLLSDVEEIKNLLANKQKKRGLFSK